MKHNEFQKKVSKQFEKQGAWTFNIHGHRMQKSGTPDLLVIHRDWSGFIEIKIENDKVRPLQKSIATKIIKRLFPCYVLRCKEHTYQAHGLIEYNIELTIEDFDGNIVVKPNNINDILSCLIDFEELIYKDHYKICREYVDNTQIGESICIGDGEFIRVD